MSLPDWARWDTDPERPDWTVGIEEEIMLLDPETWALAQRMDDVLPTLPEGLVHHVTAETHGGALELATRPHATVGAAVEELCVLRGRLLAALEPFGLRAGAAGTHPFAVWQDTRISSGERYQFLYGSMRELARREPTFALHVHVGVPTPERAVHLANRLRGHIPLFLALSASSPYWQGRDTGLASARTPLFQAFPRVGIPRAFASYGEWVETVDLLLRCDAFPEPTFLWWDVRLQPRFGTVEVRIMDAQSRIADTAALTALVQAVARLEDREGYLSSALVDVPEVLDENRFLAARDGMTDALVDPNAHGRRTARELMDDLLEACRPHADALGAAAELARVAALAASTGAERQRAFAGQDAARLPALVQALAEDFVPPASAGTPTETTPASAHSA